MAICWDTTDDGDINIINGNPVLISDKEELIRALDARLHTSKGAFSELPDVGMETSWMVNGNFRDKEVISAVEACLLQDERVVNVTKVNVIRYPDNENMDVEIILDSTLGQLNFKEVKLSAFN